MDKIYEVHRSGISISIYPSYIVVDQTGALFSPPVVPRKVVIPMNQIQRVKSNSFYERLEIFTVEERKYSFWLGYLGEEGNRLRDIITNTSTQYAEEESGYKLTEIYKTLEDPSTFQAKRISVTFLEIVGGWLGFLGLGNLLVGIFEKSWGFAVVGITLLVIWWGFVLSTISGIVGSFGLGLVCVPCCLPVWAILPIISGIVLNRRYQKDFLGEDASPTLIDAPKNDHLDE